jgi:hypothetical protein
VVLRSQETRLYESIEKKSREIQLVGKNPKENGKVSEG